MPKSFCASVNPGLLISSSLVLRTFSTEECAADLSIILEPMIATAKTLTATIDIVKQKYSKKIKVVSVVASSSGLKELEKGSP